MICPDREPALNGLIDGALTAAEARQTVAHLAACPGCAAGLAELLALRAEIAALAPEEPAPEAVRSRIAAAIAAPIGPTHPRSAPPATWRRAALAGGLALAAAIALAVFATAPPGEGPPLRALADATIRNELPRPQTAKRSVAAAWFVRHDLTPPPVPRLDQAGFDFVGFRADLVAGHRAAVLIYGRNGKRLSLFAWPAGAGEGPHPPRTARARAMTVIYWNDGRTEFWAVGTDPDTIAAFAAAYRGVL